MSPSVVVHDFSGIYSSYSFLRGRGYEWIDLREIGGTVCFLDPMAGKQLQKIISAYSGCKVRLLDRGDFHYMTRLWCSGFRTEYALLLIDNHPDTQAPRFPGVSSCGSWLRELLSESQAPSRVILAGADASLRLEIRGLEDRISYYSSDELGNEVSVMGLINELVTERLPVYVSIDLDVLEVSLFRTNWDQGQMTLDILERILRALMGKELLGVDICGEESIERSGCLTSDNPKVLKWLLGLIGEVLSE